ncbi:MAG: hypothetical protein ABUL72_03460, partial [Armatimonadota bacterium]
RLIPASNLVFAANGAKLFARASGGGLVAFPLPNSPRGDAGAPRQYDPRPGEPPVAVGMSGKRVVVATSRGGVLTPWFYEKRGGGSPGAAYPAPPGGEERFQDAEAGDVSPALQPFFWIGGAGFVLDADGALFRLVETPQGRSLERMAARVAAAAVVSGRLVFVAPTSAEGPARIAVAGGMEHGPPTTEVLLDGPGETAFFGHGGKLAHPEHGLAAVEHPGGEWEVLSARGRPFLLPFAGTQVVGVGRDAQRGDAGLLLLDEDRRTLVLAGLSWTRKLPPA